MLGAIIIVAKWKFARFRSIWWRNHTERKSSWRKEQLHLFMNKDAPSRPAYRADRPQSDRARETASQWA